MTKPTDRPDIAAMIEDCLPAGGRTRDDIKRNIRRLARAVEKATIERAAYWLEDDGQGMTWAASKIRALPRLTEVVDE